jgi:saccharopine dehydrogenase-like NADP-dependent oxidoreductase
MTIKHIFVIGAGTMGNGIAQVAATSGYQVTCMDVMPAALEKAKAAIAKSKAVPQRRFTVPLHIGCRESIRRCLVTIQARFLDAKGVGAASPGSRPWGLSSVVALASHRIVRGDG